MPGEPDYDRGYASGVADGARTIIRLDLDRLEASSGRLASLSPESVGAYNEAIAILRDAADSVAPRSTGHPAENGAGRTARA